MQKCIVVWLLLSLNAVSANTISISLPTEVVNGIDKRYSSLRPGDTLMLEPGSRGPIQFSNLNGDKDNYIVIINGHAGCDIEGKNRPYGISIRNCRYIRLTGNGARGVTYGIRINSVEQKGAGLGISDKTSDIEVAFLEIANINGPGILCKTNPDCNTGGFTQYNTLIHHDYVHHTKTEGMYIGSTAYEGVHTKCDSITALLMPPVLEGVRVFDNRVEYTGWDGIQISDAIKVECFRNNIRFDSRQDLEWQNSGIVIGGGASGNFYDNNISKGKGYGISCFGKDSVAIIRNTINMDSTINKTAIYVNDKLADSTTCYTIMDNSIRTEFLPAINLANGKYHSSHNIINNKILTRTKGKTIHIDAVRSQVKQ